MNEMTDAEQIAILQDLLKTEKERADENYLAFERAVEKLEKANADRVIQAQRIAALEAGLKPFSRIDKMYSIELSENIRIPQVPNAPVYKDWKQAAALLAQAEEKDGKQNG